MNCVERDSIQYRERKAASKPVGDDDSQGAVINGKAHTISKTTWHHISKDYNRHLHPPFAVADPVLRVS
jgi:hypothetical protein